MKKLMVALALVAVAVGSVAMVPANAAAPYSFAPPSQSGGGG